ncbi:MAG: glycosyltransferase family 4 protein [Lachnospiraceae bacterium]|nr:glycosyltransferase family 4 protein [Lachnospiraceae bacterium]
MRIGIDARILKYPNYKGIAYTTWRIIQNWAAGTSGHQYVLMSDAELCLPERLPGNWRIVVKKALPGGLLWEETVLPGLVQQNGIDVFWGPNFLLPRKVRGCPYVVTVHDLGLFRYPGTASVATAAILRLSGKRSCQRAEKVIAISRSTARDVHELFGIPQEKITVCYNGADGCRTGTSGRTQKGRPYFLFLSTIEPRKNPETVLAAYEQFMDSARTKVRLVFCGGYGWKTARFRKMLACNRYREYISVLGYVTEEQKWRLLKNAVALLYPSLYEGFGLPVLEAFSVGVPVITGAVSSLPETGGDAAIYLRNPKDAKALAARMKQVYAMTDKSRAQLHEKMQRQVAKFSWDKTAANVMAVLQNVLEE